MYQSTTISTAPDGLPVSMNLAAMQLRKEVGDCDEELVALTLAAAVDYVQHQYGLRLLTQTLIEYHTAPPSGGQPLVLFNRPLTAVTKVEYKHPDTEAWTEATLADFTTSPLLGGFLCLYPVISESWPTVAPSEASVRITCTGGYGDTGEDVPAKIRQAILLMLADFYENRENPRMSLNMNAAAALLHPYRSLGR